MKKGSKRPAGIWQPADSQAHEKKYGKEKVRVTGKAEKERMRCQAINTWGRIC
jgi:hypothetical protein